MTELQVQSADGTKQRFPLDKQRITIGRSRENDVFLPDQWLSRHHAEIRMREGTPFLADLGSKNGTLLNGVRVTEECRLRAGDVVTLGEHLLTLQSGGAEPAEEEDDANLFGTQMYSARELSDVGTKPVDAAGLARQNRVLSVLSKSARALLVHRPLPELFDLVIDLLFEAVPAERAAILLLEGPDSPVIKSSRSRSGLPITRVSRSIARRVLDQRVSLLIPNILEDATLRSQDSIMSSGIRAALCAPLWYTATSGTDQDAVIGLVYLDTLARQSFGEDDLKIVTAVANVAASKIENVRLIEESIEKRRLEEDIHVAAGIQQGLLPRKAPQVPGYDLAGSNRPCHTVGGDYYDFSYEQGQLLMALGDVSGKGIGAALLMTVLRAAVRAHWAEAGMAEAVARINRTVCQNVPENKYVTFCMAQLDPQSGRLTYVNAGHNPPLLVRADGPTETLTEGGMVLGMFESVPFAQATVDLRPGDTLVIYSDGVTETFDAEGNEFAEDRLADVARRGRGLSAEALEGEILRDLELFSRGAKATDDRTLIVLKRT
jgi:serine phosphatase RsbU (regulator of sigma subunit)